MVKTIQDSLTPVKLMRNIALKLSLRAKPASNLEYWDGKTFSTMNLVTMNKNQNKAGTQIVTGFENMIDFSIPRNIS